MISQFIEASNGFNYGKFLLLRFDEQEAQARTALPEAEGDPLPNLFSYAGSRKFRPGMTMVVDLQTGEGAAFSLEGGPAAAKWDLDKHKIWVCPMYEFFLEWLYTRDDISDITALPRYVQLDTDFGAFSGYRRSGGA